LVPVRNGARPEAPEGSHSTQAGTAPELAGALAPDDPPEPDRPEPDWPVPDWPEDVTAADPLDRAEVAPEEPTEEAPPVEVLDLEAAVEDAVPVADEFTAPRGFARLVPAPAVGAAAVCAAAGSASTTESSNARCSSLCIRSRSLKRFLPIARLC
jgi:hypothetical protein